jgi:rRNA maturation protein Nop10
MNERRSFAVLGGVVILTAGIFLLRRGPAAVEPAAPRKGTPEPSVEAPASSEAWHSTPAHDAARKARDEKRAEILAAIQRRRAASAPLLQKAAASASTAAAEDEPPRGHYEASYIRQVFREDMFPIMKQCYDSALKRRPTLGGKLVLKFAIVGDPQVGGVVEDAEFAGESDLQDDEMQTCVRESLLALTFDKPPEGGGKVTVTYPILFSPDDEEEVARREAAADGGGAP